LALHRRNDRAGDELRLSRLWRRPVRVLLLGERLRGDLVDLLVALVADRVALLQELRLAEGSGGGRAAAAVAAPAPRGDETHGQTRYEGEPPGSTATHRDLLELPSIPL